MHFFSFTAGLTSLACLFAVFILRKVSTSTTKRECQPPPTLPSLDPFFGLDSVFHILRSFKENRRNLSMQEQLDLYGLTFRSNLYGRTKLFTAEPRNLQTIFSTKFASFGVEPIRLFEFAPFIGKGIMTTDGLFWAHSRSLLRSTFNKTQISKLSAFDVHVTRLIDLIPKDGTTVDLQPLFARLALDSSTEFLFGESVESLTSHSTLDAQEFLSAYSYGQAGVGRRLHLPKWNLFTRDPKFWKSCRIARKFVEKHVDQALFRRATSIDKEEDQIILVYELAKETDDREDIRNQLLNVFLPAHDAVAVSLTNIFFNLARHPNVWAKLRQEVLDIGSTEITFGVLKSLKYLQRVISETMRLYPVIGSTARVALHDTILPTGGGSSRTSPIFVKKGDIISTSFYALHRLNYIYGDSANEFDPDRWVTLRVDHWGYLPFGGGPRICPGQQLALTEIAYAIVRILQTFREIENKDPTWDFVESYKITTESKNGAKVVLIPAMNQSSLSD